MRRTCVRIGGIDAVNQQNRIFHGPDRLHTTEPNKCDIGLLCSRRAEPAERSFKILNVRSIDITTAARIRQVALELFAAEGVAGTSVRAIAAKAEVSPALILHHYGSKDGLCQAVDEFAVAFVGEVLDNFAQHGATEEGAKAFTRLAEQPALIEYMSRSIVAGGPAGEALFAKTATMGIDSFTEMQAAGLIRDVEDPQMVALYLLAADLGMMLLRSHIERHFGVDPMTAVGIERLAKAEMDLLRRGIFNTHHGPDPQVSPPAAAASTTANKDAT